MALNWKNARGAAPDMLKAVAELTAKQGGGEKQVVAKGKGHFTEQAMAKGSKLLGKRCVT